MIEAEPCDREHRSQPPCEAVSWNPAVCASKYRLSVSLLVRLWVEILQIFHKYLRLVVSLLVRLWVEIQTAYNYCLQYTSASLWGCELKYVMIPDGSGAVIVSLLVRLWVEIFTHQQNTSLSIVSLLVRLWVEMFEYSGLQHNICRQPPCEAVSWNIKCAIVSLTRNSSASLWGCELK